MRRLVLGATAAVLVLGGLGSWLLRSKEPAPVLDPEPLRYQMERFESALYDPRGFSASGAGRTSTAARELLEALSTSRDLTTFPRRRAVGDFLMRLAATAEAKRTSADVVGLRKEWEDLRDRTFRHAAWFLSGSPALDEAQTSKTAQGVPGDSDRYAAVLDLLDAAADRAEFRMNALPESVTETSDPAVQEAWGSAKRENDDDVERIKQQMPVPPVAGHLTWRRAYDDLDGAMRTMTSLFRSEVSAPAGIPNRFAGGWRVRGLRGRIATARRSVDAAVR